MRSDAIVSVLQQRYSGQGGGKAAGELSATRRMANRRNSMLYRASPDASALVVDVNGRR